MSSSDPVTDVATVQAVPEARDITDKAARRIAAAMQGVDDAQEELELSVAQALLDGASIRAVVEASGLSSNTVQKYGRAHGWPTKDNRRNFNASRYPRRP